MKKLVLSTIAAALVATSASAVSVGVGSDIVGGQQVLRIAVDGLTKGLRVEPRVGYMSNSTAAVTPVDSAVLTLGIGAYYDVMAGVAVGAFFDTTSMKEDGVQTNLALYGGGVPAGSTTWGLVVKTEKEIIKNLSIAYEIGVAGGSSTNYTAGTAATTTQSTLDVTSAVTMRLFF